MNKSKGLALSQLKGFTIIELIVVIAIIAVLATIVMTSVMVYMNKGKDAAVKGNMQNLFAYGTAYFIDNNSSYDSFCTDPTGGVQNFITAIENASGYPTTCTCDTANCVNNATAWCMMVQLRPTVSSSPWPNRYCVDSTGLKREAQYGADDPSSPWGIVYYELTCSGGVCGDTGCQEFWCESHDD